MRKMIRIMAAIVVAAAACVAGAQVAGAQYPPVVCVVTINPATVAPGGSATLSGSVTTTEGPAANSPVSFTINGEPLGSTNTDGAGDFSLVVTIPNLPSGTYTIVANCGPGVDGDVLGNTDVNVDEPNDGGNNNQGNDNNQGNPPSGNQGNQGSGNLARTGSDLGLPVQIGVGLLALGGIILALSASRRRSAAT